jgi:integrase
MARPKLTVPRYRRHRDRHRDRAFVELAGQRIYLGEWSSPASKDRYSRILAEWQSGNRQAPVEKDAITVMELAERFWEFAEGYYLRPDGSSTRELGNYRSSLRPLKALYGETLAKDFGPKALKAVREKFIEEGACRNYVNQATGRLKRVFKWAVAEELLSPTVYAALQAVPGLKRGRSTARESEPVRPVPEAHVEAIRPHVSAEVWALIQLQQLTAARSGELVVLRPRDLETSGRIWTYRPAEHKTAHHGHERTVYLGPQAQEVLRPFLADCGMLEYIFSPRRAEARRRARQHAERKTPLSCGNGPGKNRKRNPEHQPGTSYTVGTYGHAIARACKKADVPHWHPHQLRHGAATFLRKEFGIDAARVMLGHRSPSITESYAELDKSKALEVAGKIG